MQHGRHRLDVAADRRPRTAARGGPPVGRFVALAAVVASVVAAVAVGTVSWSTDDELREGSPATAVDVADPSSRVAAETTLARVETVGPRRWVELLERLDERRGRAWGRGRPELLTTVYAAGTPELARDRASLRAYLARGLRVDGVSLRFAAVDVVGGRRGWVRLRVVDQLCAVRAVTADDVRRRLPRDRPSRHLIDLRREPAGWRIAAVVAV